MRSKWIAYAATGVIAVGAGVAVAGLPSDAPAGLVITSVPTTTTSPPVVASTTTTTSPGEVASTTTAATATTTSTSTTTTVPLRERAGLAVGVANATDEGGVAGRTVDELRPLGYEDLTAVDSAPPRPLTQVFHAPGLEAEAARLAEDAGLDPTAVLPLAEAPATTGTREFELLLVVGLDRV